MSVRVGKGVKDLPSLRREDDSWWSVQNRRFGLPSRVREVEGDHRSGFHGNGSALPRGMVGPLLFVEARSQVLPSCMQEVQGACPSLQCVEGFAPAY